MSRVGSLRHRITVQAATEGSDDMGQVISTWTDFKTMQAAVDAVSSTERILADSPDNPISYRFITRYDAGIDPDMRVVHDGKTYEIRGVLPLDNYGKYMRLDCTSVLS